MYARGDLRSVELDGRHEVLVAEGSVADLQIKARDPEALRGVRDLGGDGFGRADEQRAVGSRLVLEAGAGGGRPPTLAPDAVGHRLVVRPERLLRLLVR